MRYFLLLIFIIASGIFCNSNKPVCLKAKVLRVSCASFVVQVLNKDSVGSYGWKDVAGHGVYNNVFTVANSCKIGKWGKGEEFYFNISDSLQSGDCMACMMYDAPPEKSYTIVNVSGTCKESK